MLVVAQELKAPNPIYFDTRSPENGQTNNKLQPIGEVKYIAQSFPLVQDACGNFGHTRLLFPKMNKGSALSERLAPNNRSPERPHVKTQKK
jgi:hypothetical protein